MEKLIIQAKSSINNILTKPIGYDTRLVQNTIEHQHLIFWSGTNMITIVDCWNIIQVSQRNTLPKPFPKHVFWTKINPAKTYIKLSTRRCKYRY